MSFNLLYLIKINIHKYAHPVLQICPSLQKCTAKQDKNWSIKHKDAKTDIY